MGDEDHRHIFIHESGGCIEGPVASESLRCDDRYVCECGANFHTKSDSHTHSVLPAIIIGKERDEDLTKPKEQLTEGEISELQKGHPLRGPHDEGHRPRHGLSGHPGNSEGRVSTVRNGRFSASLYRL